MQHDRTPAWRDKLLDAAGMALVAFQVANLAAGMGKGQALGIELL